MNFPQWQCITICTKAGYEAWRRLAVICNRASLWRRAPERGIVASDYSPKYRLYRHYLVVFHWLG